MLINGKEPIFVIGYPRSGNNWTARLLGDLLNCPIGRFGAAAPICMEGLDRPGKYQITVLHLHVENLAGCSTFVLDAYRACPSAWDNEKLVIVQRDPRDIAVSAWKFFDYGTLQETLEGMIGEKIAYVSWNEFVTGWNQVTIPCVRTSYEKLAQNTTDELRRIVDGLKIQSDGLDFAGCVKRQSFDERKVELWQNGDSYMYGKALQVKNLRLGKVGDWKNYFTPELLKLYDDHLGKIAKELGYD